MSYVFQTYRHAVLTRAVLDTYLEYGRTVTRKIDLLERRLLAMHAEHGTWGWCRDVLRARRAALALRAAELLEELPLVEAAVERVAVQYTRELAAAHDVLRQMDSTGRLYPWAREALRKRLDTEHVTEA